ncbi:hypothetical protein MKX01_030315 [Papaver californicum]|nr:hypothetical protein MKX01_030315 [Papaver californicum]
MKVPSSKSIRSPSHNDKSREPSTLSISSSLNNRRLLRGNNGSIKAGQFSPMMFPTGSSKKRGCAFETPEPSSPKVTCIGQVRVKTKKRGKKILARKKRTAEVGLRNIDRTSSQEGLLNHHQQKQHQHSCLPYRNQKWVHFPLTICETLRSFGADLNCFLPCGTGGDGNRASISDRDGEEKRKNTSGDGKTAVAGSCGPFLDRWLMAFQEGEVEQKKTSEQVIEMMYGDEVDEEEIRERVNIMKMMEDGGNCKEEDDFEKGRLSMCLGDDFEKGRLSMCLGDDLEKGRGSVCLPPKNALLLMRCRSDPLRMSSLTSRFWDSAVAKEDDNDEEYESGVSEVDEEEGEEDDEEVEVEEEEALSSELDEECEVKVCLENGFTDENQANNQNGGNQEDPSKVEELVKSIPAQGEKDEEKEKSVTGLEQNEEITSNGDTVIIEENPAAKEQPILQEVEKNHELEHNSEAGKNPRTREQDLVLQEVEDQEVKRSEAGDGAIAEKQPFFQEIEDVQKLEQNKVNVGSSEIEDMLQEVVGSDTASVENLVETFMLRTNEDPAVDCNTGSVENLETEEEFRLQVVEDEQEVEHETEAIENSIAEEEEIVFEEIVQPGIEEAEEREMRSFEMFVEPQIDGPALVTAEGDQAILDLQEERLVKSSSEEKGIEDIIRDEENEKEIAEEACAISVANEKQEAQIHEDNEGGGEEKSSSTNEEGETVVREEEEKSSSTNEEGETVVREEQEAQNGNDNEEYEEKLSLADGKGETERKPAVLPEFMMWMMMSEPKLSIEVSKETWVCSGGFTRKFGCHGRVVDDSESRQPQLTLNNKLTDYMRNHPVVQQRQQRRLP